MNFAKYMNDLNQGLILLAITLMFLSACIKRNTSLPEGRETERTGIPLLMKKDTTLKNLKILHTINAEKWDRDSPVLYSDIFKSVEIVPLETTTEFLISDISQVRYVDNNIFVFDGRQSAVFIFDRNGKALKKIYNKGSGPDEYTHVRGFDIDEKEKLIYLYTYPLKVFKYDYNGVLVEKLEQSMDCINFAITGTAFAMYSGNQMNRVDGQNRYCRLWVYNLQTGAKTGYEEFDPEKVGYSNRVYNQNRNFYHYKDEVLFFYPFSNRIYGIEGDEVYIKYYMDFGERNLPLDYFGRYSNPENAYDDMSNLKYVSQFWGYWENDRYWAISCFFGRYASTLFFDKMKDKVKFTYFKDDMTDCSPLTAEATNEFMLSYIDAERLFSLVDYIRNVKKTDVKNKYLKDLLQKVNEDSNPILFFYSFK